MRMKILKEYFQDFFCAQSMTCDFLLSKKNERTLSVFTKSRNIIEPSSESKAGGSCHTATSAQKKRGPLSDLFLYSLLAFRSKAI